MTLWQSPIQPLDIFSQGACPAYPTLGAKGLIAIQAQVDEKGRLAPVRLSQPGVTEIIARSPYQCRSGVNEYGGKCFCLESNAVFFNDYSSGEIYRTDSQQSIHAVSDSRGQKTQYADLTMVKLASNWVVAIQEHVAGDGEQNQHAVVAVRADGPVPQQALVLVSGADFYANPVISQDGKNLAWLEWNHPDMPWDRSVLKTALIVEDKQGISLRSIQTIIDTEHTSICQLGWLKDGSLVFAMDSSQIDSALFWNLYRWDQGAIQRLTNEQMEYGEAHWVCGQSRWVQADEASLIAIRSAPEGDELVRVFLDGQATQVMSSGFSQCEQLSVDLLRKEISFVAHYPDKPSAVLVIALDSKTPEPVFYTVPALLAPTELSLPEVLTFPTRDGQQAHGFYYPPKHVEHRYAADEVPPVVVMVHGGPTSRSRASFSLLKQYFTTSGFAVFDVNHRGSTGYGRAYRQALLGKWGEIDATDIADGVDFLVQQGLAHPQQIFIRGGSAGGYAVLRALTRFPDLFRGGACYYGIGNLITLSEITHKFESHYTDQLIGEAFDPLNSRCPDSEYVKRSPIFEMDKLKSPVILFQGLEDKVVPPEVSREVVATLKRNGVPHEYIEYEGEGHGFRQKETRIDALNREMTFYTKLIEQRA